jgi:ribosomal protein S27AE
LKEVIGVAALKSFETPCPKCGKTAFAVSHPGPIHCPECGDVGLHVFVCERTKKGYPALWEQGGGYSNSGEAQIIAGPRGEKLKPIYIRTKGHRACGQHALFVIQPEYYIIIAGFWNKQNPPYNIAVYKIIEITEFQPNPDSSNKQLIAVAQLVNSSQQLTSAIEAAREKTRCYHCRQPHYALL